MVLPADTTTLAARMCTLAVEPGLRVAMAVTTSRIAAAKGHARYAEDFKRFVDRVLSMPRTS